MNNNKYPYDILAQDKSHIEEESDFSENEYKNKNFKIQKYEKFKPKSILKENSNKTLKGAENKVKFLLSIFLKNIQSEEKNSRIIFSNNTLKMKDKDSVSIKKKAIKKINTSSNKKFGRTNSFNNIRNNDKLNIYKNIENNKFIKGESTPKSTLFSHFFHTKKVGFNLNHPKNLNITDNQKEGNHISKKKMKKNSLKISNTLKNTKKINDIVHRTCSYNSEYLKKNKVASINESPKLFNRKVPGNKRGNSNNLNNIRSIIKKADSQGQNNNYLNFKNDGYIININNNDIREHKKKKKITFKNIINNLVNNNKTKKNINANNNNIFNELNINSIMSENSDSNINRKSFDIRSTNINKTEEKNKKEKNSIVSSNRKKSSSIIRKEKEFSSLSINKNSIEFTDISYLNTILVKNTAKPQGTNNLKHSLDIKSFKRSETSVMDKNNPFINKNKFRRLNTHFKSLKQQLKKSIILRPDEVKLQTKEKDSINNSICKKRNNSICKKRNSCNNNMLNNILNFNVYKNKKSSNSNNQILKLNKNLTLGLTNSSEMKKKNNSNKNVINIQDQIIEQTTSVKKLNTETENQETVKPEKKESSKTSSFEEDYSPHSIKRTTIFYEKYRILTHKGNVYDSLDDEEFEDEEDFNVWYISPFSSFSITFDSILFIFSIISFIEIPLYLAINHDFCRVTFRLIDGLNLFIECLNALDLFLGFFRAYYNWEEQLIKKNRIIAFKYLTGWFLFDLIASIPVYSLIKINEPFCNKKGQSCKYYNIVLNNLNYLFINNRLFKILKVFSYNQGWKYFSNKMNDYWGVVINIGLVFAALNYTACLYIFIGRNSYPNWILHTKLESYSFMDIYICAIYILIMALTTVGYGDITCYSLVERIFQLFLLVIGIMAYSWLVSSFSNYIKKLNERTADFEKKKSILDEIKFNHKNLPESLYERILRYLKFKNFHEKKLINIIFDCLPVGLKNNLISEMYKPIIKNFIFFKNFQNTDFIVRVILCFKPILAYKNDILVNAGDMLEEIMFVKRGTLTVELPLNMTNPQENIDKYLNTPFLKIEKGPNIEKIGNSTIIHGNNKKYNNILSSINENENNKKRLSSFQNTSTYGASSNNTFTNNQTLSKKKTIQIETTYVKILGIRENEHFGDVLMFLERRSPLRVRVRSKKCELFFLKKMDAVKISTSYQNIWKRINKRSVFNFEQIKKSIRKIVEIYCSVKKVNSSDNEELSDGPYAKEFGIKESGVGLHPQNFDLNNSAFNSKKKIVLKKNKSLNNEQIKNLNQFFKDKDIQDDYFMINNQNINKDKKNCVSTRIDKDFDILSTYRNKLALSSFSSSSSNSSSSSKKNVKDDVKFCSSKNSQKLIDVFKGNYKFYKKINKNNKDEKLERPSTIISEEPDKECSFKYTNSIQKLGKLSPTNRRIGNTLSVKKSLLEEEIKPINENDNEDEDLYTKNLSLIQKNSSSLIEWNKNNTNFVYNNQEDSISNNSSFEKEINEEIYPGEEIQVNKEENLLNKKIDLSIEDNLNDYNSDFDFKNTKIEKLLKSFDKIKKKEIHNDNDSDNDLYYKEKIIHNSSNLSGKNEDYKILINDNNSSISNHFCSNKNNHLNLNNISSKKMESSINIKMNWDSNILSINNNISLQFDSSYENYNLISGEKLIKNKDLQNKVKNFLINEISNLGRLNSNNIFIKKTNSFAESNKFNENKNSMHNIIRPIKRFSSSNLNYSSNLNSLKYFKNKVKKKIRNCSSLLSKRSRTINSNTQSLEKTSSFYENNYKYKKSKNKFKTGIGPELFENTRMNMGMTNKFGNKKLNGKPLLFKNNNNNISSLNNANAFNNSSKELQKKLIKKRRNSLIITNFPKIKKKKENLLSQINFNIQKSNQNLNNPDEFYSCYFNFLLEGEIEKNNLKNRNNQKMLSTSMIDIKRKKTANRKSYLLKK